MLAPQQLAVIMGYTFPFWLFCLYMLLGFKQRSVKGYWLRSGMLALPLTALVIAVTRLLSQNRSYDGRQDLWVGLFTYGIAWAIGRYIERTKQDNEPVNLKFLESK
jgi:Kef-type K+ transport system membrane component KefB